MECEKSFKGNGINVTVTTKGASHAAITITGAIINGASVNEMSNNNDVIKVLREIGFKNPDYVEWEKQMGC